MDTSVDHENKFLHAHIRINFKLMGVACKQNALWPEVTDVRCPVFSGCGIPVTQPSESQRPSSVRNWESEILYSFIEGNIIYMYTYRPEHAHACMHARKHTRQFNEELPALLKATISAVLRSALSASAVLRSACSASAVLHGSKQCGCQQQVGSG